MKTRFLIIIFAFLITVSCSSDIVDNETQKELTDAEITALLNENWEKVSSLINQDYLEAESPAYLSQYLDQIKSLRYIKDAYIDDNALHVITEDGSGWHWLFTPAENTDDDDMINTYEDGKSFISSQSRLLIPKNPITHTSQRKDGEKVKVLIFNQTSRDESRVWTRNKLKELSQFLTEQGFEVVEKGANYSMGDLDQYDICLLHTHGFYEFNIEWIEGEFFTIHTHLILSSVEKSVKLWRSDEYATVRELRNGKLYAVTYEAYNEKKLRGLALDFKQRNTFVFVTACESLMKSDGLAKAFFAKGASGYVGYDSKASVGLLAADHFLRKLCEDYSIQEAIDDIPQKYKFEHKWNNLVVNASLKCVYSDNDVVKDYCYAHICPAGQHPHFIDMGNGTKWSCCNIGAQMPYDIGDYYSWGETSTKHEYSYNDNVEMQSGVKFPSNIAKSKYDVAWLKSGHTLSMPTTSDFMYLVNNCDVKWDESVGVKGALITSRINGNKLFIPAGGWIFEGEHLGRGDCGILWSANRDNGSPFSWFLQAVYNEGNPNIHVAASRYSGHNVRGVAHSE